ncbi:LytTR family DNA-binding domain-containing protein [Arcicella rosea]|uniref:Two-component system LytT family response regulator n=1 Tax=Arcicella rosea TaxID=502909 RepID=A0A841ESX2_9BACT|nr:LytTR family DNA-binding domain-containing protein [Arcicella rosea]MBB6003370.1 two-component system LytT family response regulator [Arcicella rosea]
MSSLTVRQNFELIVDSKRSLHLIIEQIIMLEAESNYTLVHTKDGNSCLLARCINAFDEELTRYGFLRVHKSYIINPQYVLDYIGKERKILLENNLCAPIARRKKSMIRVSSIRKIIGKYPRMNINL